SPSVMSAALRVRAELGGAALCRALGELTRRHETLRTRFETEDGRPVQVIEAPRPVGLEPIDLSGSADPERELRVRLEAEATAPADLARGPGWRALLFGLGRRDHALVIVMHHIVTDGW